MSITGSQGTLFDMEELARDAIRATSWHGAPLAFHTDYYSPADLDQAFERYVAENGRFGCLAASHMWHRALCGPTPTFAGPVHEMHLFSADTRCDTPNHRHPDHWPNQLVYQAICPDCRWHAIGPSENEAVEAWHDHAMPGWRNLPTLPPVKGRDEHRKTTAALAWLTTHYPADWQVEGAPVITQRSGRGTRHVPGRSPYGGYDLAAPA